MARACGARSTSDLDFQNGARFGSAGTNLPPPDPAPWPPLSSANELIPTRSAIFRNARTDAAGTVGTPAPSTRGLPANGIQGGGRVGAKTCSCLHLIFEPAGRRGTAEPLWRAPVRKSCGDNAEHPTHRLIASASLLHTCPCNCGGPQPGGQSSARNARTAWLFPCFLGLLVVT